MGHICLPQVSQTLINSQVTIFLVSNFSVGAASSMCFPLMVRGFFKAQLHREEIMDLHKTKEVSMLIKVWKHILNNRNTIYYCYLDRKCISLQALRGSRTAIIWAFHFPSFYNIHCRKVALSSPEFKDRSAVPREGAWCTWPERIV